MDSRRTLGGRSDNGADWLIGHYPVQILAMPRMTALADQMTLESDLRYPALAAGWSIPLL